MRRDEILDRPAWDLLGRLRLAQASGKAAAARWTLNADGIRILTSFSMADGLGAEELETLLDVDQDVRGGCVFLQANLTSCSVPPRVQ